MDEKRPQNGFTLLEILFSMSVLMIGMAGVMGLSSWLIRAGSWSVQLREATLMAQSVAEEIRDQEYAAVTSGLDVIGPYTRQWIVTTSGTTKLVDLNISWESLGSGTRQISVRTLLSDPDVPGVTFL